MLIHLHIEVDKSHFIGNILNKLGKNEDAIIEYSK